MDVRNHMKKTVYSIPIGTTIGEAARVMIEKHIGMLPVIDEKGVPVGVVSLGDLLQLELPDFINLLEDIDFVHDFGAVEITRPSARRLAEGVHTIMKPIITIEADCGLLRAYANMLRNDIYDMPVTDEKGALVGLVSRVDIGSAILSLWPRGAG